MKKTMKRRAHRRGRHNERGAALIIMLLISMLLLAAGGALIMSTALSTGNAYEATPEMQAYYAAETGLEDVLAVLRGNVAPRDASTSAAAAAPSSPFAGIIPTASAAATPGGGVTEIPDAQKISLRRAVEHQTSDLSTDPENAPKRRLSRWLNYDYTPPNGAYPDRVSLVDNYSPLSGTAYRVVLSDPDNSTSTGYTTTGIFKGVPGTSVSGDGQSITFNNALGGGIGTGTITFLPRNAAAPVNRYPSSVSDLGSFRVTSTGIGATIPPGVTFNLSVNQTAPWVATSSLTATLSGLVNPIALLSTLQVGFLRDSLRLDGTVIRLTNLVGGVLGLLAPPSGGSSTVAVQASITAPEPRRVLVLSTGFGPKGAQKRLEMMITRANLDFDAPATLTLRGANDCSPLSFNTGSSNAKDYNGADVNGVESPRPAFAVTACDYDEAVSGTKKPETVNGPPQVGILDNGSAAGSLSSAPVGTPGFLETADKARQYLSDLEITAQHQGRYFKPGAGTSMTINSGTAAKPVFTFVDGDCNLDGGAGLLVVTGNLNMSGNPSFDGVVLVLGGGSVNRSGGGNGNFNGAMVVAKFARTWPVSENSQEHPFLAPSFNTNGGGASTMQYSSAAVTRALSILGGPRVSGIAEL